MRKMRCNQSDYLSLSLSLCQCVWYWKWLQMPTIFYNKLKFRTLSTAKRNGKSVWEREGKWNHLKYRENLKHLKFKHYTKCNLHSGFSCTMFVRMPFCVVCIWCEEKFMQNANEHGKCVNKTGETNVIEMENRQNNNNNNSRFLFCLNPINASFGCWQTNELRQKWFESTFMIEMYMHLV